MEVCCDNIAILTFFSFILVTNKRIVKIRYRDLPTGNIPSKIKVKKCILVLLNHEFHFQHTITFTF